MVLGKIGGEESLKALEEMKRKGMPYWHEKAIEEAIAKIRERLQRK
jgi:hypothetical protein